MDIFLSYSRADVDFVSKLQQGLESNNYKVWRDEVGIDGGTAWESEIETNLEKAKLFVVVISPTSNQSQWVRRETIHAEQLGKIRIPLLFEGNMPLRLLDVQFVDFRESNKESGFHELLQLLKKKLAYIDTSSSSSSSPGLDISKPDQIKDIKSTPITALFDNKGDTEGNASSNTSNEHNDRDVIASSLLTSIEPNFQPQPQLSQEQLSKIYDGSNDLLLKSSNTIQSIGEVDTRIAISIIKTLNEAHYLTRILADQITASTGISHCNCYYNMACIISLVVEVEVRLIYHHHHLAKTIPNTVDLTSMSPPTKLLKMARAIENLDVTSIPSVLPFEGIGSIGWTLTRDETKGHKVGQLLLNQLEACRQNRKQALVAGFADRQHMENDRDLMVLRQLYP